MHLFFQKKITKTIEKIDFENPEKSETYEEFNPFLKRIIEENFEKKQREEIRRQFSANVSHELKTPLTSISGFAEMMKSGLVDLETMKNFSEDIYNESQRMILLVNDILKLSKLDEESISIEKENIGFAENEKERIFERFYRIDKSRSKNPDEKTPGTGLGLSIVKHGAKYHNAKVTVKSVAGEGSEFSIVFGN